MRIVSLHNRKKPMPLLRSQFVRALSILLGSTLIAAGVGKGFLFEPFVATVASSRVVPEAIDRPVALAVIAVEILGGSALVLGVWRRTAPTALLLLIGSFIVILTSAIIRGNEFDCNCFGGINIALSNRNELALDMLLFDGFVFLVYAALTDPQAERNSIVPWKSAVVAVVLVALQVALWLQI